MKTLQIKTSRRSELVDITARVREAVRETGIADGVAHLWSFHTTCGLTVNEGADPDVARDVDWKLSQLVPRDDDYHHAEGNSDSHVKTSLLNPGAALLVSDGDLVLGTWQAVFLCEFDGPRTRKVGVQVLRAG
ncbi:MAG: YjbQ family protein [Gemmatimonadetes bacterium]|uniref:YjbQ family protein n=1 Tax=Candidatus Kutchimonas denitrificans TaxID=3056748 RepID=A0AAE5CCG6_9BACT|nr:YjbQ family protein [Gemmatimonadota bacterium]NIR74159.1 YjbQ family protein [Candidatus Kutchimonas denitrificans]NIS01341.1 YjbQ family protein [Gemmatimonadota bacterium]NIT67072.1 YjbQ family protein [Gemmatimonadota bacterium]NIU51732.1 YjbQ family protein [Gemmatimonadota bacterium]